MEDVKLDWKPQHWRNRGSYAEIAPGLWYAVSPIMTYWQVERRTNDEVEILEYFNLEGLAQAYVERIVDEPVVVNATDSGWRTK